MRRGVGCYLIDERNRRYLDCVNNVAHVGHSNGAVLAAVTRQLAVINTNSRYLLEILGQIEGDAARFTMADAASPTVIRDVADGSAMYVLMPMRV